MSFLQEYGIDADQESIRPSQLVQLFQTRKASEVLVIDVRDNDVGLLGCIRGSMNWPAGTTYNESRCKELAAWPVVVVHCMCSSVRGPREMKKMKQAMAYFCPGYATRFLLLEGGAKGFAHYVRREGPYWCDEAEMLRH